jgi:hypothetical protein
VIIKAENQLVNGENLRLVYKIDANNMSIYECTVFYRPFGGEWQADKHTWSYGLDDKLYQNC